MSAAQIASISNTEDDKQARIYYDVTEWQMNPELFKADIQFRQLLHISINIQVRLFHGIPTQKQKQLIHYHLYGTTVPFTYFPFWCNKTNTWKSNPILDQQSSLGARLDHPLLTPIDYCYRLQRYFVRQSFTKQHETQTEDVHPL